MSVPSSRDLMASARRAVPQYDELQALEAELRKRVAAGRRCRGA
jgi:hypothetical protein